MIKVKANQVKPQTRVHVMNEWWIVQSVNDLNQFMRFNISNATGVHRSFIVLKDDTIDVETPIAETKGHRSLFSTWDADSEYMSDWYRDRAAAEAEAARQAQENPGRVIYVMETIAAVHATKPVVETLTYERTA